ncbi:SoxR reducing system RseC family protein [Treponema sp.]|uniref:SoxR reducing system RseC family protein n=1 Tax=Treponema sp. TaxID=166 RepID=UPI00388FCAEF
MRDFAIVKKICGQNIEVVSLISDACVSCGSLDCAKKGKSFVVLNKKNLPLTENSVVRIGFPKILRGILGFLALVFPIAGSAAGLFLSPLICSRLNLQLTQTASAVIVLLFFFISAFIVFIISRTDLHISKPEVFQVM